MPASSNAESDPNQRSSLISRPNTVV